MKFVTLPALHSHLQAPGSNDIMVMNVDARESTLAEADMASVFQQIWREKHKDLDVEIAPQQGKERRVRANCDCSHSLLSLSVQVNR